MPLPDHDAVRILKPGVLRTTNLIGECRACGSIIEVPKSRAKYEQGDRPGESGAYTYTFPCQTHGCTESVWLGNEGVRAAKLRQDAADSEVLAQVQANRGSAAQASWETTWRR